MTEPPRPRRFLTGMDPHCCSRHSARFFARTGSLMLLACGLLYLTGCTTTGVRTAGLATRAAAVFQQQQEPAALQAESSGTDREGYDRIERNPFRSPRLEPLSTFSLDVDTASYSNARRFIEQQQMLPPPDAIRIEELVNYFPYRYAPPADDHALAIHTEVAEAPWEPRHRLVRIGVKARELDWSERAPANFVFLIDVSGSMQARQKLPLVKQSLRLLVDKLDRRDRIAIVVYAGESGLALPSTPLSERATVLDAIDRLRAGGSTNAGAGLELAYTTAWENYLSPGNNRLILCTDGDFNVGVTSRGGMTRLIEAYADRGVFLTVAGFGMGNYRDGMLEELSNRGDGTYAYIDTAAEARKLFVDEAGALYTVAKDVKAQVEFNPARVQAYRLVGYENRTMAREAFNDDTKDAGDIGAGHTVTVLYEVVPFGVQPPAGNAEALRYQERPWPNDSSLSEELLTVKVRYKHPGEPDSRLLAQAMPDPGNRITGASPDFQFAAAVAGWGMLLVEGTGDRDLTYGAVLQLATNGALDDPQGHRKAFIELARRSERLERRLGARALPAQRETLAARYPGTPDRAAPSGLSTRRQF